MSPPHGAFVWYELMTSDPQAAAAFYRDVIGWTAQDAGMPGKPYTLFSASDTMVAGLMAIPDEVRAMGIPPCWTGYVGVADVDAMLADLRAAGGTLRRPAEDIPTVGRFAVVADPQGAVFILFPDPWPKARHHKRRLIQPEVLIALARVLKPGGRLRFATDWADYADWTLERVLGSRLFAWPAERAADWRDPPADHVTTRYEEKKLGDCAPVFLDFILRATA